MKPIESFDEFFDHCEKNNIGTVDADVFVKALRRKEFEKLIASSPSYLKLVFQHGERLFIFEDCQYKIAAVQLAWELEQHNQSRVDQLKERVDEIIQQSKDFIQSCKNDAEIFEDTNAAGKAYGAEAVVELLEQALKGGES